MHDQSENLHQELTVMVRECLKDLLQEDFDTLKSLPSQSSEEATVKGKQIIVFVMHEKPGDADHHIVVRAYKHQLLGTTGKVYADGFVLNDKNERRQMSAKELAKFK